MPATVLVAIFFVFFALAMDRELDHDEQQFVAAGALWGQKGLLPYRDFAYFHTPVLPFVLGTVFEWTDHLLLAARWVSAFFGSLAIAVIFALGWQALAERQRTPRLILALSGALLLAANPLFLYTVWKAWNHAIPLFLLAGGILFHWRAARTGRPGWFALGGACIALAAFTRISYAPFGLPFLIMAACSPGANWPARARGVLFCGLGMFAGALPAFLVILQAPEAFLFDNFVYNGPINSVYRSFSENRGSALVDKVLFGLRTIAFPSNLTLIVLCGALAWWQHAHRGLRHAPILFLFILGLLPFALLGALAPTPAFSQYFSPLALLLTIGCLAAMANIPSGRARGLSSIAFLVVAAINLLLSCGALASLPRLFAVNDWTTVQIHRQGQEIASLVPPGVPVLTLAPILPLEGGADIYPELASGPFGWRTAPFIPRNLRLRFHVFGQEDLPLLAARGSIDAIYVGHERRLDKPLAEYAKHSGLKKLPFGSKRNLWVRPAPTP